MVDRNGGRDQPRRGRGPPPPKRPVVNPNSRQAELLASVASDMNTFSNDGSFMQKFAASQGRAAGQQDGRSMADEAGEDLAVSGVAMTQNAVCKQLPCTHRAGIVRLCMQLTCCEEHTHAKQAAILEISSLHWLVVTGVVCNRYNTGAKGEFWLNRD